MPKIDYKLKNGTKVSGVTTILNGNIGWNKQQLMYWSWNLGMQQIDYKKASEKEITAGTVAHIMIEKDLKGETMPKPPVPDVSQDIIDKAETAFLSWLEWKDRMKFRLEKSELSLVSEEFGFGGTIDFIPEIDGKLSIFDFKTGSGIYEDHLLQVSAYSKLASENGIDTPGGIHILNLGKEDASFKHFYWQSLPEAWEAFLAALKLHNLHKILKKMV